MRTAKELYDEHLENLPIKLDKWQKEALEHGGNMSIRAGRQVGKSTVIAIKAAKFAIDNPNTTTLIIAASQRQSSLLFEKVRAEIEIIHRKLIEEAEKEQPAEIKAHAGRRLNREMVIEFENQFGIYDEQPTLTKLVLKNGSKIYSLPAGKTGYFIRGFTLDLIIADEAAYIPETVWLAITPMIAVSRQMKGFGWLILLSTPFGKGGYFYDCCHDPEFMQFHISSENCARIPRDFLRKEKQRLSKQEYAQEYLGEFVEEFNQLFSTDLIKKRMSFISWEYDKDYKKGGAYYLGVDIARFGEDENAFVIGENDNVFRIVKVETTERKSLTDTVGRILKLDELFHFRKIFIDDAGVGGGVYDMLLEKKGNIVVGLNNAKKSLDRRGERKGRLLKEDLYSNAIIMMEKEPPVIEIISDLSLLKSLKSMTFEYTAEKNLKIFGVYSHLAEAFVRCCWTTKAKGLNIYVA